MTTIVAVAAGLALTAACRMLRARSAEARCASCGTALPPGPPRWTGWRSWALDASAGIALASVIAAGAPVHAAVALSTLALVAIMDAETSSFAVRPLAAGTALAVVLAALAGPPEAVLDLAVGFTLGLAGMLLFALQDRVVRTATGARAFSDGDPDLLIVFGILAGAAGVGTAIVVLWVLSAAALIRFRIRGVPALTGAVPLGPFLLVAGIAGRIIGAAS